MNFDIEIDSQGRGELTWEKKKTNLVNIYLSVKTRKGAITSDPEFGLDISDIKVVTETTIETIKQRYENALSWMIPARKAREMTVVVTKHQQVSGAVNVTVTMIQVNGVKMQFVDFVEVGGVSGNFIFP